MENEFSIEINKKTSLAHNRPHKGRNIIVFPDDYCVIDIETTGLSPDWDDIIEIAACKIHKGNLVSTFSSLVRPNKFEDGEPFLSEFITNLTGITDNDLSKADSTVSVLSKFYSFISNSV